MKGVSSYFENKLYLPTAIQTDDNHNPMTASTQRQSHHSECFTKLDIPENKVETIKV